jgi:hypothetical protein
LFKNPISVPLQNLTTKPIFKLQWVQHRTNIVNYGDPAHITILHISNSNSSLTHQKSHPQLFFVQILFLLKFLLYHPKEIQGTKQVKNRFTQFPLLNSGFLCLHSSGIIPSAISTIPQFSVQK